MSNDLHVLRISHGKHRGKVKNVEINWKRFCKQFEQPSVDADISFGQYSKLSQDDKAIRKARPGYLVGAQFAEGVRRLSNMGKRYVLSFDFDVVTPDQMFLILGGMSSLGDWEYLAHTTRGHCPEKPRWRVHMPLKRPVDHDEANALTRIIASRLLADPQESIDTVDVVSHRYAQVSYLPSISRDQEYLVERNAGRLLDPDEVLASFPGDWKDHTQLPTRSDEKSARPVDPNRKMEDPREKPGLIGAFCRAYDIEAAIAKFLPDIYTPGESTDGHPRYSYALGSSANGAVVYDDGLFITSHHGTDPIAGSANAWDMVRIHLFGHLDRGKDEETSPGSLPSFKAMSELAEDDPEVKAERAAIFASFDADEEEDEDDPRDPPVKARKPAADDIDSFLDGDAEGEADEGSGKDSRFDAADDEDEADEPAPKKAKAEAGEAGKEWIKLLVLDKAEKLEKSHHNAQVVLCNDPRIAPCIAMNDLSGSPMLRKPLRFKKRPDLRGKPIEDKTLGRLWEDSDTALLATLISNPRHLGGYDTNFSQLMLQQAMLLAAEQNRYNPILDQINRTSWDGVPRVETLFIDWLKAEDNAYHRELAKVWCIAAVTRLHEPGHKFDLVPIIGGKQGGGKSSFIELLSMTHGGILASEFNSTQKMVESIRGKWLLEISELKGLSRSEVEDVKQFLSGTADTVRLAYRHNEEDFKRRCVFMGTTNQEEYLKDTTGNRRFCPVRSPLDMDHPLDFAGLRAAVPQIWAEAQVLYFQMRKQYPDGWLPLTLTSHEARATAQALQESAREESPQEAVLPDVLEWLNKPVPASVALGGASEKFEAEPGERFFVRGAVTAAMALADLADKPLVRAQRGDPMRVIAQALALAPGWERAGPSGRARVDGKLARWFIREGQNREPQLWLPAPQEEFDGMLD